MYSVEKIESIFWGPDIEATAEWYERVLGWKADYDAYDEEGRCTFGSVHLPSADDAGRPDAPFRGMNLSRYGADAAPYNTGDKHFTAMVHVDDVDAVYERAVQNGATVDGPPQDQDWGFRIFGMADVNGFGLMVAQDIQPGK